MFYKNKWLGPAKFYASQLQLAILDLEFSIDLSTNEWNFHIVLDSKDKTADSPGTLNNSGIIDILMVKPMSSLLCCRTTRSRTSY